MTSVDGFTWFVGAADGTERAVLDYLGETSVMISYSTKLSRPWRGIEELFLDSGAYSLIKRQGHHDPPPEYAHAVLAAAPDFAALQDLPNEPDALEASGRTLDEQLEANVPSQLETLDAFDEAGVGAEPVPVIQGWELAHYLESVDELDDYGLLEGRVGIGTLCRRNVDDALRRVVLAVREAVPNRVELHAFGVKGNILRFPEVRAALSSADSLSYSSRYRNALYHGETRLSARQEKAFQYLHQKRTVLGFFDRETDHNQTTFSDVGVNSGSDEHDDVLDFEEVVS